MIIPAFRVTAQSRFVDIGATKDAFMEFEEGCDGFPVDGINTWRHLSVFERYMIPFWGVWPATRK